MNRDEWGTRVPGECLCLKVRRAENVARAGMPALHIGTIYVLGRRAGILARATEQWLV